MNRNVEAHFSELPQIDIERSIFDRSCSHKTSFNVGELIPFYVDEVLPGDTFNVTTSCVVRLQTPLTPIMDDLALDLYYFYVPNRIVWSHWKEFMGENRDSPWVPSVTYTVPKTKPPSGGWNVGTIADYMGIPVGVYDQNGNMSKFPMSLPFRGYAAIADQFFRDQNLSDPINITLGDSTTTGSNGSNYITDLEKGGKPFQVCKWHDYFTSALPYPQKGPTIGLFNNYLNQSNPSSNYWLPVRPLANKQAVPTDDTVPMMTHVPNDNVRGTVKRKDTNPYELNLWSGANVIIDNLFADAGAMNVSINDLRIAFQLQKFYERNARSGTRYRELLKAHFGVTSSDARMMIPEYLGGKRIPIVIHQVANQAQSSGEPLGDVGAMSNTADIDDSFIKSFEEHGFVIGVCCVRYSHSYPQGLERFWCRSSNLDYYYPVFANIGEQALYKYEVMWTNNTTGYEVFGYQEPWSEYRYKPNRVSGEMRPGIANSLATWHLADYYSAVPSLSDSWIREDTATVDRVLTVAHTVSNQIFADFYVRNICTRPMPMYSIPGLIDHH